MQTEAPSTQLAGKLLLSMPGIGDPRFERSVVFLCAHSEDGALGLIVNKPLRDVSFAQLLSQVGLEVPEGQAAPPISVHFGGPVEHGRGFVLHSGEYRSANDSTLRVDDTFAMTATLDILEDIAAGRGPDAAILALGYAGWGPGQLEGEIRENGWLICEARPEIVFAPANGGKWGQGLAALGIDPVMLSGAAGRA